MRLTCCTTLLLLLGLATPSQADLLLTLASNPADLSALSVGQTIEIQVSLSGLGDGGNPTQLSALTADVSFPVGIFGSPLSVTEGGIVPSPALSFTPVSTSGTAGGVFDNIFLPVPGPVIDSTGLFFKFQVTALAAGSGVFSLAPPPGAFDELGGAIVVISGSDLPFTVVGGAIPEPSSVLLFALGVCAVGYQVRRRQQIN
jgi:hypothetical protein